PYLRPDISWMCISLISGSGPAGTSHTLTIRLECRDRWNQGRGQRSKFFSFIFLPRNFFVKLEDGSLDDILQSRILLNAHFRFGYAFLPNAKPGRYAAIGCRFHVGDDSVWFEGRRYQTLLLFN